MTPTRHYKSSTVSPPKTSTVCYSALVAPRATTTGRGCHCIGCSDVDRISSRRNDIVTVFRTAAAGQRERLLLDGKHLVEQALRADLSIKTLAMTASRLTDNTLFAESLIKAGTKVITVTESVMDVMSPVVTPSGIVAIAERPPVTVDDVLRRTPQFVVGLVDVQNPGNLGAVIRTAEAGGATGIAATGKSADPYGWKALRGAMGGTFHIPVTWPTASLSFIADARASGLKVVAATVGGGKSLYEIDLTVPTLVMVGGESSGLSQEIVSATDQALFIPMPGSADSLNAATAAALIIYEAFRQRCLAGASSLEGN